MWSPIGSAQLPRTSSLSWVRLPGAESCISTQKLASAVEKRIGRRAFVSASQADISLEGRVERLDGTLWRATLVMSDPRGRNLGGRVLKAEGEDCAVLEPSLILVVAIAIDPGAALSSVAGPDDGLSDEATVMLDQLGLPKVTYAEAIEQLAVPDPNPPRAEPMPPKSPRRTPRAARPPPRPGWEVQVALGVLVESFVLPEAATGGSVLLAYMPAGRWGLELEGDRLLEVERELTPAGRARLSLFRGGVAGCFLPVPGEVLSLRLCGGPALGALSVETSDFMEDSDLAQLWSELRLGGRLVVAQGALLLHLGLRGAVPLTRDRLRHELAGGELRTLHRPGAVALQGGLGVGLRFR